MHEDRNPISNAILSRVFRSDPKAAQYLRKLYGYEPTDSIRKPNKERTKSQAEPKPLIQPKWNNVHNKVTNEDPHLSRFNKHKASAVSVPSFDRMKAVSMVKLDLVPHRKSIYACNQSLKEIKLHSQMYRPPPDSSFRQVSYDYEKSRLQDIFTSKGVNSSSLVPRHDNKLDHAKERRHLRLTGSSTEEPSMPQLIEKRKNDAQTLRDQILLEIKEREDFHNCHAGEVCESLKRKLDDEIRSRMEELRQLELKMDARTNIRTTTI